MATAKKAQPKDSTARFSPLLTIPKLKVKKTRARPATANASFRSRTRRSSSRQKATSAWPRPNGSAHTRAHTTWRTLLRVLMVVPIRGVRGTRPSQDGIQPRMTAPLITRPTPTAPPMRTSRPTMGSPTRPARSRFHEMRARGQRRRT